MNNNDMDMVAQVIARHIRHARQLEVHDKNQIYSIITLQELALELGEEFKTVHPDTTLTDFYRIVATASANIHDERGES